MQDNIVPLRTAAGDSPLMPDADHLTKIAVRGFGIVLGAGPEAFGYHSEIEPAWALPNNVAFWMSKEGRL